MHRRYTETHLFYCWHNYYMYFFVYCQLQNIGGDKYHMAQLTEFGKTVRKWLIDNDKSISWLAAEVEKATGLYCDRSYLGKIFGGKRKAANIVSAIERIMEGKA